MAFNKGTWIDMPAAGTRDIVLTYVRCAEFGTRTFSQCIEWVWNFVTTCLEWVQTTTTSCIQWGESTSRDCCDWAPCSWFCDLIIIIITVFCVAFTVIVAVFCALFGVIAVLGCALWLVLVLVFCILWTLISIIIAGSKADGGTAFLLTDGTVMMQECSAGYGTHRWWKLSPDNTGSYANGSWDRLADSNVARKYFSSAVLADGRVVVCGGEYSDASGSNTQDDTNLCEIYDPTTDSWATFVPPMTGGMLPTTWAQIGDGACSLLPDGTFLLGSLQTTDVAKLDPATLTWTAMSSRPTASSEESWVLMPDNTIASVSCLMPGSTLVYDIATDTWNATNNLPVSIVQAPANAVAELGAGLLRYDGTAFFNGANQHTALYDPAGAPQWTNGPDVLDANGQGRGVMDGPAAILANGNILFGAAPIDGDFKSPVTHFEFDGTTHNPTNDPPNSDCACYVTRFLLLPNGDVMRVREDDSAIHAYHQPDAVPQDSFRPVIQSCPTTLVPGATITVSGTQFNGLSQATGYGDDSSAATNYPLFRVTNAKTKHVRYCRTFNHSSMGVATGATAVSTNVSLPGDLETGDALVEVVANGIPSQPFRVRVGQRGDG
jgi:Kelch motif protein